jgi:hypothetical protein
MKLSESMLKGLENLVEGKSLGAHLRGQSQHGGFTQTPLALETRGLIVSERGHAELTVKGLEVLVKHGRGDAKRLAEQRLKLFLEWTKDDE